MMSFGSTAMAVHLELCVGLSSLISARDSMFSFVPYLRFNVLFCSASATDGYEFHEMVDVESCCLQISRSKWFRMGSDKQFGRSGLDFVISETGGSM